MATMQAAAEMAGTLADPARLAVLAALLEGEAAVSDLAARLGLAQPRVSTHLARLRAVGLVSRASLGRHRAYGADTARVKPLLDALQAAGPATVVRRSTRAGTERRRDTPLRRARTCYDHLAGVAGVELLEAMQARGWVRIERGGAAFALTARGEQELARRAVDVAAARASRRRFAIACLDWTERRPHLGGALGAEILDALCRRSYVRRHSRGRDVRIVKPLAGWLGR